MKQETKVIENEYPISISCICGKQYDGVRARLLQCPYCGWVWDMKPDKPNKNLYKIYLGQKTDSH